MKQIYSAFGGGGVSNRQSRKSSRQTGNLTDESRIQPNLSNKPIRRFSGASDGEKVVFVGKNLRNNIGKPIFVAKILGQVYNLSILSKNAF